MQRTIHSRTRPWLWSHALPLILLAFPAIPQSEENKPATSPPPIQPEMVLLKGGEFLMGSEDGGDSSPLHGVVVSPLYLDKYEVTNSQYSEFCEATGHRLPEFWGMDVYRSGPDYPRHPVIGVSWHDADAYAKWRGARLPTEAEWEFAARGGLVGMNFSHGDVFDSTLYANTGRTGVASPVAAGSFPPNGFGLHDMTGNVVEWVHDRYDAVYYVRSPSKNPTGPGTGSFRVIRGGGWHTGPYCSRVYFRNALKSNWVDFNVGFRCAKHVGESAALLLEKSIQKAGIDTTLAQYQAIRRSPAGEYYFDES